MNPYDWYITPEEYEQAEANGISKQTLEERIRVYAWDKKRALSTPIKELKEIGKGNVKKAESIGVSYSNLRVRLSNGWSMERATTEPLTNMRELCAKVGQENKKYPTWVYENLLKNNISLSTFYKRVNKCKWTLEKASTTPIMTKKEAAKLGAEAYHKIYGHRFGVY